MPRAVRPACAPASISVNHLVEEVLDSFMEEAGKKHLTLRADTGQAELLVDRRCLQNFHRPQ